MTKTQWAIVILLVVLVVGVFGVAVWLCLRPVEPAVVATPTRWSPPTFPPTWTPVPVWVPTATEQVRRAVATVTAVAEKTATAKARIDAAVMEFPPGEIGLRMDAGAVGLTLKRAGWVRYGTIWMRLLVENRDPGDLHLSPESFTLLDTEENQHSYLKDETGTIQNGLEEMDVPEGGSVEVTIVFPVKAGSLPGQLIYDDGVNPTIALDICNWLVNPAP